MHLELDWVSSGLVSLGGGIRQRRLLVRIAPAQSRNGLDGSRDTDSGY